MCQRITAASALAATLILSGCDPCAATWGCTQAPRASVVGQVVDRATGDALPNVRVEMRSQTQNWFDTPVVSTHTRSDGGFEISAPVNRVGPGVVMITILAPGGGDPPYTVPNVPVRVSSRAGEATVLGPWVSGQPEFPHVVIVLRGGGAEPIANATLTFQRTSGPRLIVNGAVVATVSGATDGNGYSFLMRGVTTDTTGVTVGDLTITFAPNDTIFLPAVTFTAVPDFNHPHFGSVVRSETP